MRREFSRDTKREALKRSGGECEATGTWYGLPKDKRCHASLGYGVEFDHIDREVNSKDDSLSNCAAVCIKCHRWKTAKHDAPGEAKVRRQRDKNDGVYRRSPNPIRSRGFQRVRYMDPDT